MGTKSPVQPHAYAALVAVAPVDDVARNSTLLPLGAWTLFAQVPQSVRGNDTHEPPLTRASTFVIVEPELTAVSTHHTLVCARGANVAVNDGDVHVEGTRRARSQWRHFILLSLAGEFPFGTGT